MIAISPDRMSDRRRCSRDHLLLAFELIGRHLSAPLGESGTNPTGTLVAEQSLDQRVHGVAVFGRKVAESFTSFR